MESRIKNRVGPWVRGTDFFDREHEQQQLARLLREGAHVSLVAQRRVGKTSLLHQVRHGLSEELTCLYVDLQHAVDASDAIVALALATREHHGLWTRASAAFANVLGAVTELGIDELTIKLREGVLGDWRAKGQRIVGDLAASDPPVVLMFDELPVLLVKLLRRDRADGEAFLSWLRHICLAHTDQLRVVVTGSIGLAPVAHRAGLSGTLNHYTPMQLEPWTPATAMRCLAALGDAYGVDWVDPAPEEVVAELGCCIPYHIQLFFQLLEEDARKRRSATITAKDVKRVYARRMLSTHGHAELAHMEERLREVVPQQHHSLVLDLLTEAAVVGVLSPRTAMFLAEDAGIDERDRRDVLRDVMGVLEHDGYLEPFGGEHRFASKLLRDWWKARFSAFYQSVGER